MSEALGDPDDAAASPAGASEAKPPASLEGAVPVIDLSKLDPERLAALEARVEALLAGSDAIVRACEQVSAHRKDRARTARGVLNVATLLARAGVVLMA